MLKFQRSTAKPLIGSAAALISAALVVTACAQGPQKTLPSFATGEGMQSRVYRLGPGDKIKISVFGEDNLSGTFEVGPQGAVGLPLAGEIRARGLTVPEFRDAVARKLAADGILKHPKVTADVTNYRAIYVHGEVKTGGEFQYKSGLRLRDAIAMAGGYTYRADQSYVLLGRDDQKETQVAMPGDAPVLPGDNIRIPERFF